MIKKLENLDRPEVALPSHQRELRMTILSAKKSAWWGSLLIVLPALALFVVFLQEVMHLDIGAGFLKATDSPWILLVAPFVVFVLNLLSVLHISGESNSSEFLITLSVKKRFWSIAIIVITLLIVGVIVSYGITENWQCIIGAQTHC